MSAPDFPDLLARARTLQAEGDPDGADALYEQVVTQRPYHAGAWLARIELALSRDRARRALDHCDAALSNCPNQRLALLVKRARALEALGDRDAALALLADLRAEAPQDLPLAAVTAGMLHRAGALDRAGAAYRDVLALRGDHAGAWLALVEITLAGGDAAQALTLAIEAEAQCPAHVVPLQIKQLRALEALGRVGEALTLATSLRAAVPENTQLALIEAGLRRKTGDLSGAESGYRDVLVQLPDHVGAWLGRIDIAQTAGDPDRALALADAALAQRPDDPALTARRAGMMVHMGQSGAAIAALRAVLDRTPTEMRLRLELARAQLHAGHAEEARALFADCLEEDPQMDAARLGLVQAHEALGDAQAGLAVLAGHEGRNPAMGLRAAELRLQTGQRGAMRDLLDDLAVAAPGMTEPELLRFFKLGEQGDHVDAALAVMESVTARAQISPLIAQFLASRVRVIVPPDAAERVTEALEQRLAPSRRAEFRAFTAGLFAGPEEALARARADLASPRDTQGAALIGERLLDAGRAKLAFRYLRFCVARWPNAPHLRRQFLRACIETGRLAAGHVWLDHLTEQFPDLDHGLDRMQLMTQEGRLEETRDMAEARAAAGLKTLSPRQFLDLALALGDVEKSAQLAALVQHEPGAGRQNAAHFSTTLHGAQFNELRLYAAARDHAQAAGDPAAEVDARLARDFFYPAKRIVADHAPRLAPRLAPVTVPQLIFQYWNTPTVPGEVARVMQSWQDAPGFEHRLLDRRAALTFLRDHFGPRHARAFQLANSPAEECDFLRLCLLYRHGGIYADADDMLTGDAGALIAEGPGLIVTAEPWGALANNVICAPVGHPVLLWALRAAGRSLLARENDGTWFKTGPGLMTRAVAVWLAQEPPAEVAQGLTILTQARLAAFVQPHVRLSYKTSGQYWNARDRHAPQPLVAALSGLLTPPKS